jgi:hypothetical protein
LASLFLETLKAFVRMLTQVGLIKEVAAPADPRGMAKIKPVVTEFLAELAEPQNKIQATVVVVTINLQGSVQKQMNILECLSQLSRVLLAPSTDMTNSDITVSVRDATVLVLVRQALTH